MKIKLHHINLSSENVEAMDAFYRDVMCLDQADDDLPALKNDKDVYTGDVAFITDGDMHLHLRKTESIQRTIALIVTACVLYIPANVLPIMTTTQLGQPEGSTILGGVVLLIHHGSYPIAAVIFIASVLVLAAVR